MERFTRFTGLAAPLTAPDIDTDIIFPARFLLITAKKGLGRYGFYDWRHGPDGAERPEFALNDPRFRGAPILVVGDNFGCGSSREQALWALKDLGVRCLISTGFGEIFHANCFKNGILPVRVDTAAWAGFVDDAVQGRLISVDLERQQLTRAAGEAVSFAIESWRREALLSGWDEIDLIQHNDAAAIAAFEHRQRAAMPWLYERD